MSEKFSSGTKITLKTKVLKISAKDSVVRSLRAPLLIFLKGTGDNSFYYPELYNRLRTKWYVCLQVNKLHLHTLSSVFLAIKSWDNNSLDNVLLLFSKSANKMRRLVWELNKENLIIYNCRSSNFILISWLQDVWTILILFVFDVHILIK